MWFDGLTPLRLVLRCAFIPVLLLALLPTLACINPAGRRVRLGRRSLEERMIAGWSRLLCLIFGVRVRIAGQVQDAPALIVANHLSWLDIQVMHSAAAMGFVAKSEIARWPLLGQLARAGDTVFIERGSHESSADVSVAMVSKLNRGRRVAIFPEGGIRPGTDVGVFHARLFKAAVEADCLVQPVMIRYVRDGRRDADVTFIDGEGLLRNMVRMLGRPACEAELRFLPPLAPAGRPRRELAELAHAAVSAAFNAPV